MKMTFTPKISGNTEFDITLTLTLEEMQRLREQLKENESWPSWKLANLFETGVEEITKHTVIEQEFKQ